jgi:hypothetical protein
MEETPEIQGLHAIYTKTHPVGHIRRLLEQADSGSVDSPTNISLHENLIRFRNWQGEIFVSGLTAFEASRRDLALEVCLQAKEIGRAVCKIEFYLVTQDTITIVYVLNMNFRPRCLSRTLHRSFLDLVAG